MLWLNYCCATADSTNVISPVPERNLKFSTNILFKQKQKNTTCPAVVLRALTPRAPKEEQCDTADPRPADLMVCGVEAATSEPLYSLPGQGLGSCFS